MPPIQVGNGQRFIPTDDTVQYQVWVRKDWHDDFDATHVADDDNTWQLEPYLIPLKAHQATLAGRTVARFMWRYGAFIRRWDDVGNEVAVKPILDPAFDWFVSITTTGFPAPASLWTGIIPRQSFIEWGEDTPAATGAVPNPDPHKQGRQVIEAHGLEWLLDHSRLTGTYIADARASDPTGQGVVKVDDVIAFNQPGKRGTAAVGNRSQFQALQYDLHAASPTGVNVVHKATTHIFDAQQQADAPVAWSNRDIARYCLETMMGRPRWFLSGQVIDHANENAVTMDRMVTVLNPSGKSIKAILNKVIDRRRGLMAWVPPTFNNPPTVDVFHASAVQLAIPGGFIPANPNLVDVDIRGQEPHGVKVEFDRQKRPQNILVRGAKTLSMFTVSPGDGLEPAWTPSEETAYLSGDVQGSDPTAEDHDKARRELDHVFNRFKIPNDWEWKVNGNIASPQFGPLASTILVDSLAQYLPKMTILRHLLLPESAAADDSELMKPFAIYEPVDIVGPPSSPNPPPTFPFYLHAPPTGLGGQALPGTVKLSTMTPTDGNAGVFISTNPAHKLGRGRWALAAASAFNPDSAGIDYEDVKVTMAVELDTRPGVHVFFGDLDDGIGTTQVIDVPSVQTWWLTNGTIIGISNGQVQRADTTLYPNGDSHGVLLRDDTDRLRIIAGMIRAWYSVPQARVKLTYNKIDHRLPVGTMVDGLIRSSGREPVGAAVTAKTIDFENHTMVIQTETFDPDFGKLA